MEGDGRVGEEGGGRWVGRVRKVRRMLVPEEMRQ